MTHTPIEPDEEFPNIPEEELDLIFGTREELKAKAELYPGTCPAEGDDSYDPQVSVVCGRCEGQGCSSCDYDGWYYPDDVEPDGTN